MKFFEKVDVLFSEDSRTRWRIISLAAVSIAVCGAALQWLASESVANASRQALFLGALVFFAQVVFYAAPIRRPNVLSNPPDWLRMSIREGVAVAASGVLAMLASVSAPTVQAAVLNMRFRAAISSQNLDARKANSIVSLALHAGVKLRPDLVALATNKLRAERNDNSWAAYVEMLTYTVNWRDARWNERILSQTMSRLEAVRANLQTSSNGCGPGKIVLSRGYFSEGKFDYIEDVRRWPHELSYCTLQLERQPLQDSLLSLVLVKYDGGPLDLRNVRFCDVLFDLKDSPNSRIFVETLLHAEDNVITLKLP